MLAELRIKCAKWRALTGILINVTGGYWDLEINNLLLLLLFFSLFHFSVLRYILLVLNLGS